MAGLPANEKEIAKSFLNELFYFGGLVSAADSPGKGRTNSTIRFKVDEAKLVCHEIKFRQFEFDKVDNALDKLSCCRFQPDAYSDSYSGMVRRDKTMLAWYIADFCKTNEIYWDDVYTNRTTYEMDAYKKSVFGSALWEHGCFLSQTIK